MGYKYDQQDKRYLIKKVAKKWNSTWPKLRKISFREYTVHTTFEKYTLKALINIKTMRARSVLL